MASISALGIGSGMDLNGLLDQLKAAERQKLQPLTIQKQTNQAKISAYGRVEGALNQFKDAMAKLNEPAAFQGVTSTVSGESVKAAAGSTAAVGTYNIAVTSLARNYSIASMGVEDKSTQLGSGSINFSFGNGDSLDITIEPGKSSLEQIRDAINKAEGGVQASIVNDGSGNPHRLVFASTTTGTDATIADITYNGDLAAELSTDTTTEVTARNAVLTVNGISIQSQTNRVEGAIQGVTLDLAEEGNASVVVARDTGATEKAVNDFVKAYNNLQTVMTDLTKFNGAEANNGQLLGDSALRTVQSRIRSVVTGGVEDGAMRTLRDLGIEFELNGRLKVNDEELSSAVQNNIGALQQFFAGSEGSQGFSARVENTVSLLLNDSGPIKNSIIGLQDSQKRIDERFERMEISIDRTIERYRSQFSQLDSMVAQMNSTSSYLMQQFDIMNAQLGRKK